MAVFTEIVDDTGASDGTPLFQVDFLNELVLGFRERYHVVHNAYPALNLLSEGDDAQGLDLWYELQSGVYGLIDNFVRLDYDPEGTSNIPNWGSSFFEFCNAYFGTDLEGFRRATTWPSGDWRTATYAHGFILAGDILGPWIMYDLQSFMSALLKTRHIRWAADFPVWHRDKIFNQSSGTEPWAGYPPGSPCGPARALCATNWPGAGAAGVGDDFYFSQRISLNRSFLPENDWLWQSQCFRSTSFDTTFAGGLNWDLVLYIKPLLWSFDDLGMSGLSPGLFYAYTTGGGSGDEATHTFPLSGFVPGLAPAFVCESTGSQMDRLDYLGWVYTWEFTNVNPSI